MKYLGIVALLGLLPVQGTVYAGNATDSINLAVADQHIIPAYLRLAARTRQLNEAAQLPCDTSETGRQALQKHFAAAFMAWQGIQHIRFGPIEVLNRGFRYQLWPDKRGSVGRHLRKLLATPDASRLEPEAFAAGSIAVQGFSALERLLFDANRAGNTEAADWECAVIRAITDNLQQMSVALLDEWRDGPAAQRSFFADASSGNAYYENADEVSATLLNNLYTQLELIVAQKLGRPMGRNAANSFRKRAEAWRSGLSLPAIEENLMACQTLYRIGFSPRLRDRTLHKQIDARFKAALAAVDQMPGSLGAAAANPAGRERLVQLRHQVSELKKMVSGGLASELKLQLGFNSLDGD